MNGQRESIVVPRRRSFKRVIRFLSSERGQRFMDATLAAKQSLDARQDRFPDLLADEGEFTTRKPAKKPRWHPVSSENLLDSAENTHDKPQ